MLAALESGAQFMEPACDGSTHTAGAWHSWGVVGVGLSPVHEQIIRNPSNLSRHS